MSESRKIQLSETAFGALGSEAVIGTTPVEPPTGFVIVCLIPITDCVITAQTDGKIQNGNADLTAYTVHPAGIPIYGKFLSITLSADNEATAYFGG